MTQMNMPSSSPIGLSANAELEVPEGKFETNIQKCIDNLVENCNEGTVGADISKLDAVTSQPNTKCIDNLAANCNEGTVVADISKLDDVTTQSPVEMTKEERNKLKRQLNRKRKKQIQKINKQQLGNNIPFPGLHLNQCIGNPVENHNEGAVDTDIQMLDTITTQHPVKITEVGNEYLNLIEKRTMSQMESASKKKKTKDNTQEELMILACDRLKSNESYYDKISTAWAVELQKLSPEQQVHAKKAINDILYEGQLGNLYRNCVEIIPKMDFTPNSTSMVPGLAETSQQRSSRHLLEHLSNASVPYQHLSSHRLLKHLARNVTKNSIAPS